MKKVILALAVCATFAACQKKQDTDPIDVSKTTYLMNKSWRLAFYTWNPDINDPTVIPIDSFTLSLGCVKDNYLRFNTTGKVSIYEGGSKCNQSAPDSTVYGYRLTNDDKFLEIFTNPDDVNHDNLYAATITYPAIDSFVITYTAPNPQDSSYTSRYIRAYVKR